MPAADAAALPATAWPAHLALYRPEQYLEDGHEAPTATRLELLIDRISVLLAMSLGTRSWAS